MKSHKHTLKLKRETPIEYGCTVEGCAYMETGVEYNDRKRQRKTRIALSIMLTIAGLTAILKRVST